MIICDKCGKENSDDRFICCDCGRELVNRPKAQENSYEQTNQNNNSNGQYSQRNTGGNYTKSDAQVKCKNCGKFTLSGSKYCSYCGEKMMDDNVKYCRYCGAENSVDSLYCYKCGRSSGTGSNEKPNTQPKNKDGFKRGMIWAVGIIAILFFLCVTLVTCTISNLARRGINDYKHYQRKTVYTYYYPHGARDK